MMKIPFIDRQTGIKNYITFTNYLYIVQKRRKLVQFTDRLTYNLSIYLSVNKKELPTKWQRGSHPPLYHKSIHDEL